jgi:outer membrane protein OmpA-like peptidoglycan-associated protein
VRAETRFAALALLAAMAAAPPAASLSRNWYCFFDPGSTELPPRCQAILHEFAAWWSRMRRGEERGWPDGEPVPARTVQVEAEDHADAAEAAVGKASVDRARAEAVAAFLRLSGVFADVIGATWFGAVRPLVPVAGAEPQNRRAQLIPR